MLKKKKSKRRNDQTVSLEFVLLTSSYFISANRCMCRIRQIQQPNTMQIEQKMNLNERIWSNLDFHTYQHSTDWISAMCVWDFMTHYQFVAFFHIKWKTKPVLLLTKRRKTTMNEHTQQNRNKLDFNRSNYFSTSFFYLHKTHVTISLCHVWIKTIKTTTTISRYWVYRRAITLVVICFFAVCFVFIFRFTRM